MITPLRLAAAPRWLGPLAALLLASCATPPPTPPAAAVKAPPAAAPRADLAYAIGADLSFLQQAEERGAVFKDGGVAKPGLQIFRDHGYNWRPADYRGKPAPFPETPAGQREFLEEVNRLVLATPGGFGKGVFWWEPAVAPGRLRSRGMFDDDGNALPVIDVFDKFTRGKPPARSP